MAARRRIVKVSSRASRIPADYEKRIDALLAAIAEDRRQLMADRAIIDHLSRRTDEQLEEITRRLDNLTAAIPPAKPKDKARAAGILKGHPLADEFRTELAELRDRGRNESGDD